MLRLLGREPLFFHASCVAASAWVARGRERCGVKPCLRIQSRRAGDAPRGRGSGSSRWPPSGRSRRPHPAPHRRAPPVTRPAASHPAVVGDRIAAAAVTQGRDALRVVAVDQRAHPLRGESDERADLGRRTALRHQPHRQHPHAVCCRHGVFSLAQVLQAQVRRNRQRAGYANAPFLPHLAAYRTSLNVIRIKARMPTDLRDREGVGDWCGACTLSSRLRMAT
jgi:hypothetical protein